MVTETNTATITMPECHSTSFMSYLSEHNLHSMLLTTRGRFHHCDHSNSLQAIRKLCERDDRFRLPNVDALNNSLLSNIDGEIIGKGLLHNIALKSVLTEQSRWDLVFKSSLDAAREDNIRLNYIMIGEKVIIPKLPNGVTPNGDHWIGRARSSTATSSRPCTPSPPLTKSITPQSYEMALSKEIDALPEGTIAIIGMACRYPEADSIEEFWNLIRAGGCAIKKMPDDRFVPSELTREPKGPFWGGYVRQLDAFDHRFFGVSGREAKSMDPQQRLCLQVAYEAMESSGYLGLRSDNFDGDVGCYIGVANDDYVANVASHPANAFSAMGTLRAFISGRISHFFGWTGPAITLDTACSASAVAIHTACKVCITYPIEIIQALIVLGTSDGRLLGRPSRGGVCYDKFHHDTEPAKCRVSESNRTLKGIRCKR